MDSTALADAELVARIRAGDPTGLEQVYQRYARPVYSLSLHILKDGETAEDVTQDVFLKLWRQPDSYDPGRGTLGPWLLSVAHNRAIDLLRRRQIRGEAPPPDSPEHRGFLGDGELDPAQWAGLGEMAAAVRGALAQIPWSQRQAIEMAFFQGKTHLEISEELGEPLGTIKTRIRLGMQKLRTLLEAQGLGLC